MRQTEWWSDTFKRSEVAVHHRWLTWPFWVRLVNNLEYKELDETHRNGKLHGKPAATSLRGDERMWESQGKSGTTHLRHLNR